MSEYENKQIDDGQQLLDDVSREIEQDLPDGGAALKLEQAKVDYKNLKRQFMAGEISSQEHSMSAQRLEHRMALLEAALHERHPVEPVHVGRLKKMANFVLRHK